MVDSPGAAGPPLEILHIAGPADAPTRAPLVFLHEGLGSVAMWRHWPQTLCQRTGRGGWIYSRRGYGASEVIVDVRGPASTSDGKRSGRLAPDYLHHEAWAVLPQLLTDWGVDAPILVGHSDGGTIALLHASRHPVVACIVMAPHVVVEEVSIRAIERTREAFEKGDLRQRLARYHRNADCAFWQWHDIWLSPEFRAFDIRTECRSISAPVLAIQGADDGYGTLVHIDDIDLPAAQICRMVLPQCGHSPHRDQPETTRSLIAKFIDALP